ncbi:unnamed protein product, partial [Closterium sp. NIES-54]
SLPPLPPSPAPPFLPCVEGWQRAAPHSSFPPMTAPLQTLHMDVWGPARVNGEGRERYFLLSVSSSASGSARTFLSCVCTLTDVQNGIAERRIGLFMEVAHTSMIHAAAPHFLWPFAVWYAAHQLNLWPRVSLPESSPTLHWMGNFCDASVCLLPSLPLPHCPSPLPPPPRPPPLFLAPGPPLVDPLPHQRPAPSGVSQVDPLPKHMPVEVDVDSGAARGAASGGAASGGAESARAEPGGAEREGAEPGSGAFGGAEPASGEPEGAKLAGVEPGGAESEGAGSRGAEPWGAEPGGAESEGAESGGAEPRGSASAGGPTAGGAGVTAGPGGARTGGAGAAGAGVVGGAGTGGAGAEAGDPGAGGARAGGAGVGDPGTGGAGAGGTRAGDSARGTGAGGAGDATGGSGARGTGAGGTGAVDPGAGGAGAGGGGAGGTGAGGIPDSPLPAPSPYTEKTDSFTERLEPESCPALPVCDVCTGRRVPRPRPPPIPGTHIMALRPSSVPQRVPLPPPPASSLPAVPDPKFDLARAASPTVPRLLATVVTNPSFESSAASALVAELVDFAAACRLNYATTLIAESESDYPPSIGGECALGTDVLEDKQDDFECLAADTAMDAEMASWKSTCTYVNAVFPSRANIVDGMWIFRVKRPPGSLPVFKARYVAQGFSQRQGVNFFHTFSPTPKMTTLQVLLHVAAQRDYELHSLDFSTAFLQGSMHKEIWLRRPPGFTGSFPVGTQWSLWRPIYGLRQAPRKWHNTLRSTLAALGFAPSTADPSLFLRTDTSLSPLYVLVYGDDLFFATADTEALALVKLELQKRHTCTDLGELRSYLGL